MTKFSVLLPTRNRLKYLRYAVESVLQQNYPDWEIIISDNDSEEDIRGYVASLAEPRIKYYRTPNFIPVTDNWNNALEKSTGDYVIMLGDDDCLLNNYFTHALSLIKQFQSPDFIYSSAFQYAYPEVFPGHPEGMLQKWGNAIFFEGKQQPFIIEKEEAIPLVKETMQFKVMYNYNAQFVLVHRSLIRKLQTQGPFYQSPYPDYYSTTALFLNAQRILAVPDPLVVVGITPKSFGFYYFNKKENEGNDFLKNVPDQSILKDVEKYVMPGTDMNSSWMLALETVKKNYGNQFNLKLNYSRYRLLQILHHYKKFATDGSTTTKDLWKMSKHLFWTEKIVYLIPFYLLALGLKMHPNRAALIYDLTIGLSHPRYTMTKIDGQFRTILDVFEKMKIP